MSGELSSEPSTAVVRNKRGDQLSTFPRAAVDKAHRAKAEQYRFLSSGSDVYLPPLKTVSSLFLSQLETGEKLHIKYDKLKKAFAPRWKELNLEEIKEKVACPMLKNYLPDGNALKKIPKGFVLDIMRSLNTKEFDEYVNQAFGKRQARIDRAPASLVGILPEFGAKLLNYPIRSDLKGRSSSGLTVNTSRKRKLKEIDEEFELSKRRSHTLRRVLHAMEKANLTSSQVAFALRTLSPEERARITEGARLRGQAQASPQTPSLKPPKSKRKPGPGDLEHTDTMVKIPTSTGSPESKQPDSKGS